ncbi:MAG: rhomboid family intramembrane serine protease [bacterium]|nr:rhomboid family intramembrane serine protease [bacterium]
MPNEAIPLLTYILIIVTLMVTYRGFNSPEFFRRGKFEVGAILQEREVMRLITSGFLHANWAHFLFNMYCFHSFGSSLELIYGLPLLAIIYAASLLGGNLLSLGLNRNRPRYAAIGASGAVSGVIYASIFLLPGGAVRIMFIPINIPSWIFAVAYILISIFGMERKKGRIGHEAHLGGALTGMLVVLLAYPGAILASPILFASIVLIMFAYLIYTRMKTGVDPR